MGLLSFLGKVGNFASRFAGRGGFLGSLASGVSKAANLITKYAPKVMNIQFHVKDGLIKQNR